MALTSTVTDVKTALADALTEALPHTQVSYGFPGDVVERECVWLADVRGRDLLVAMSPSRIQRDEEFDLRVIFDALTPGKDQQSAELRAFTLFAALENTVADDPSLGGLITTGIYVSEFEATTALTDVGASARINAVVTFKTRLL